MKILPDQTVSFLRSLYGIAGYPNLNAVYYRDKEYEKEGSALYHKAASIPGLCVFITLFILLCKLLWKVRLTYSDNANLAGNAALVILYCITAVIRGTLAPWGPIIAH